MHEVVAHHLEHVARADSDPNNTAADVSQHDSRVAKLCRKQAGRCVDKVEHKKQQYFRKSVSPSPSPCSVKDCWSVTRKDACQHMACSMHHLLALPVCHAQPWHKPRLARFRAHLSTADCCAAFSSAIIPCKNNPIGMPNCMGRSGAEITE